jgi:hypothetical protein
MDSPLHVACLEGNDEMKDLIERYKDHIEDKNQVSSLCQSHNSLSLLRRETPLSIWHVDSIYIIQSRIC